MDPQIVAAAIAALGAAAGGFWAYKRKAKSAVVEEWKELAEVRGQAIDDMDKRILGLEERIAHLEGAYKALQGLKATDIADEVVVRLDGLHLVDV